MPDATASPDGRRSICFGLALFAATTLSSPAARAGTQVWTGGAPRAKGIEAIVSDPLTPARMWAASFGSGVLRTLDGGATWTAFRTGLVNTYVRALAVQPHHPDSVYCGTNDGVFLSVDGGVNWNKLLSTNASVRSIAVHPIRTGVVYATTAGSGIYKSTNGGNNWSTVNLGLVNTTVRDVALDPAKPETLFAATGTGGGVHRSLNGGLSWSQVPDTTASLGAVEQIQFDRLDPNRIYACMLDRGVIKSADRGLTWVAINRGLTSFRTRALQVVDTLRYLGTDGAGVFFTTLNDTMWHTTSTRLTTPVVDALLAQPSSPSTCWAGTDGGGIFRTPSRGTTWSQLDGGLLDTYAFSLAVRPSSGEVYDGAGFGDQVWRSGNGASGWIRARFLFTHDSVHGIAPDPALAQTVYLAAYGAGVYRSDDDGLTWFNPDSLGGTLGNVFVRDLVAYPGQSGHLYVGSGNGVWESLDGGARWDPLNGGGLPASFSVRSLALVPGAPPTLYAGSDSAGVWSSADGGQNWTPASSGIPVQFIHALAADLTAPLTAFAATDSGVYRTTNGGASWTPMRSGLPYGLHAGFRAIVQDPTDPAIWFAGSYGSGVFMSVDHGVTWQALFGQAGLGSLLVRSLAVDGARATVYAGTDDGVWSLTGYKILLDVPPASPGGAAFAAGPNPAAGDPVAFTFGTSRAGPLELEVFDVGGGLVRTVARRNREQAGPHTIAWDLRDERGNRVAPGVYLARLRTLEEERALRVIVLGR